jgi:hypothetical protein
MQGERYIPPRFWWVKRIGCAGAAYLLLLAAVRLWWGWEADRRFQAAVEKHRAAGEPVLLEDFVRPPIADEENAAYFLGQAAKALQLPPGTKQVSDIHAASESDSHGQLVCRFLELNRETLRLIAAARNCPAADWQVRLNSPVVFVTLPHLRPARDLARLAVIAAAARHDESDDAGALEAVEDTLKIGAAVADNTLISHLVRIALDDVACGEIEKIAPTMQIGDEGTEAGEPGRAASRNQVLLLTAQLLDEMEYRGSWVRCLEGERMFEIDIADAILAGRLNPAAIFCPSFSVPRAYAVLLRPACSFDKLFMFESTSRLAEAAGMPDWPAAAAYVPLPREPNTWMPVSPGPHYVDDVLHVLSSRLLPTFEPAMRRSFRTLANRRMAATALAIRLYENDHGCRPERLDDLVPEYLPAVPRDPFAADDRVLSYAPDAWPPVLYSVYANGADDGGRFAVKVTGGITGDPPDWVFFLNGDRPRAKGSVPTGATQPLTSQPQPASRDSGAAAGPKNTERQ